MRAGFGLDQLDGDAQAVAALLHAAFDHVGDAQLLADVAHIRRAPLVGEGGVARDDEERADARQRRGDRLDDAVGEVILSRLGRHVVERQHDDGRLVGQLGMRALRRRASRRAVEPDRVDPDRARDVLELLIAHVLERRVELAAHLPVGVVGDADAAGLGDAFEARGDVDAVAENVAVLDDDVADVDADAELDALVLRHAGVALGHAALDRDRAAHGVDDAGELDQDAVAGGLDDAAGMLGDLGIDQLAAMRLEARQRAFLVVADQPAVAGDVGCEDGGQPPLNAILGHRRRPTHALCRVYGRLPEVSIADRPRRKRCGMC